MMMGNYMRVEGSTMEITDYGWYFELGKEE